MQDNRIIEIELKRTGYDGRKKLFNELMEDLKDQMEKQLVLRDATDSLFILTSIADNYIKGKLPIKLTYRITGKPIPLQEERKSIRGKE